MKLQIFEEDIIKGNVSEAVAQKVFGLKDQRGLYKHFDFIGKLECKTWSPCGRIALETWSVLETKSIGWAVQLKENVTFMWTYSIDGLSKIKVLLCQSKVVHELLMNAKQLETAPVVCRRCFTSYRLPRYNYKGVNLEYKVQHSYRQNREWHSAAVFVSPDMLQPNLIGIVNLKGGE